MKLGVDVLRKGVGESHRFACQFYEFFCDASNFANAAYQSGISGASELSLHQAANWIIFFYCGMLIEKR